MKFFDLYDAKIISNRKKQTLLQREFFLNSILAPHNISLNIDLSESLFYRRSFSIHPKTMIVPRLGSLKLFLTRVNLNATF